MNWMNWLIWTIRREQEHRHRTNSAMKEIRRNHYRAVGGYRQDRRSAGRWAR